LSRLATDLGPQIAGSATPAARFIDSAANALGGNGDKLRQTLTELSGVGRILADGSGNIIDIIKNLQTFVTALRDSGEPIVQFEDRLASLSNVLDGSRSDLNAALTNLSVAVGEVQRFVAETRDKTSEQVQRLANVTQNLADHKQDLEQLLHVFPTSLVNFYNIFDPLSGTPNGSFAFNNFNNPVALFCSAMAAVDGNAMDGAKKCAEYLGPALRLGNPVSYFNINYLPFPINPILGPVPTPDQLIYSEPGLIPGGPGAQGLPPPPTVDEMLLPAERPPS
jgi:ABC-type transporter Mla subunit MlaD